MADSNSILAVIDPTAKKQPALERASAFARQLGVGVELFICDYDQNLAAEGLIEAAGISKGRREILNKHLKRLRHMRDRLKAEGIEASVDACWDHPLDQGIIRKVIDTNPVLVVKDTHYHAVLKRTIFSNTDWNLIRACPASLLLVKAREMAAAPIVLACVDPLHEHDKPAELDHAVMTMAKEVATATHGELHVFHAFDAAVAIVASADTLATPIAVPVRELTARIESEHRTAMRSLLRGYDIAQERIHVYQGPTADLLVRVAEQIDADIVIMGAVSRSGLKRVFIGSTAERALDRLPCDLLIVKTAASTATSSAES
jgi:universal stress protein E